LCDTDFVVVVVAVVASNEEEKSLVYVLMQELSDDMFKIIVLKGLAVWKRTK